MLIIGSERMWRLYTAIMERPYDAHQPVPELKPLAPKYDPLHHRTYVAALENAITRQPTVRNIALSGTYGTGKSSILAELAYRLKDRVLEVSLLTLGEKPEKTATTEETNPAAATTTNRIQKEIVKQLLYQQKPSAAPESRFRRITRIQWRREVAYALLSGLAVLVVLAALGVDISALPNFGAALEPLPSWLRTLSVWAAIPVVMGIVVLIFRLFIHGRLGVEKVSAGPATITLPARSTSYFDEYLDEIIYFFETNRKRDILIIEDLDRFNDSRIFESLRSLNSLLNAAKQLNGRNIRFIYAVRDSVFEKLGRDIDETSDQARNELKRANRTKFFELVIPVVPFITHKNARDLMLDLLEKRGHEISKELIDLAARHVADMRLIHNIVNEYEIFEHRLLKVENPVPELNADRLFAMILLKNAHMGDFEAIRHGTSSLDKLFTAWRDLVSENLQTIRRTNDMLHRRNEKAQASSERAAELAAKLVEVVGSLAGAEGSPLVRDAVYVDGTPITQQEMATTSFWRKVAHSEVVLSVLTRGTYDRYNGSYTNVHMVLTAEAVRNLIGEDLNLEPYEHAQVLAARKKIDQGQTSLSFLRRHTWKQLVERPDFRYSMVVGGSAQNFREIVDELLPSALVVALIVGGYITPHFTLYVSSFYGQLIRPDAMIYIMKYVDHGIADSEYPLDSADVEAIIRDQGTSVLQERSMFNVSIFDHLLSTQTTDIGIVVRNLCSGNDDDLDFVNVYLMSGAQRDRFVIEVAPHLPEVFETVVSETTLDVKEKAKLLDGAIGAMSDNIEYCFSTALSEFVTKNYADFPSFIGKNEGADLAKRIVFLQNIEILLPDLTPLSDDFCIKLAQTGLYRVSAGNLERVTRDHRISLDHLKKLSSSVYAHAVSRIDEYKSAYEESSATKYTIEDPAMFGIVLSDSPGWQVADFDFVVENAHPDCRIEDLTEVPRGAWPAIVAGRRAPTKYGNIARYVDWRGALDEALATSLLDCTQIPQADDAEESERTNLALAILNASTNLPDIDHRISLVSSLKPGTLPTEAIEPEPGQKVGRLIEEGIILDDEAAFSSRLMLDWPTLDYAIRASSEYEGLVSPETLDSKFLPEIMSSRSIKRSIRSKVLGQISQDLFLNVPPSTYYKIADADRRGDLNLNEIGIKVLIKGSVEASNIIDLVAKKVDSWEVTSLQVILREMGDPYGRIADRGWSTTKLDDTPQHRAILRSLQSGGIVSSFPTGKDSKLKVSLKRP
ncbi:hypothetical protein LN996_07390 [Arthrobacter sp. AK01]|uniref:YobI family P-loop NTPase n=1 Tax=Arthrobacter sp. AK01 TaxID=2894084 RepID=UPI001E422F63|nr:P-loop NTPase fold protein [Arthrobacter sp. AK01]MCD4850630.1 hypothetical protein [Arthrobacter sp. AK01]